MAKQDCCQFPEKLFESFANHELLNEYFKKFKKVVLWSPSQTKEASLGYDAMFELGTKKLIAIQYKIPTYKYKKKYPGCYRFNLHKGQSGKFTQNKLLVDLLKNKIVDKVVYCAPNFMSVKKLNNYSFAGTLFKNHVSLIEPVPLPTSNNHFCVYGSGSPHFHSANQLNSKTLSIQEIFKIDENDYCFDAKERKSRFARLINDVDFDDIQGIMFYSIVK